MGKKSRDKGYRGEYNLMKKLQEAGIEAYRVPLSGATKHFKHDLIVSGEPAEVKVRANGFKEIYKWLEGVKYLFIKRDRDKYLVVMRLDDFIRFSKAMQSSKDIINIQKEGYK